MKKISKGMILCLLISAVFVMPISAMKNEVSVSANTDYSQNPEFVPGEFIIKFTENTWISSLTINELNSKYQVFSMDKVFKNAENTILEHIYKCSVPEDADILSIVDEYSSLPNVVYAEPNYIGYLLGVPNDEYFPIQWSLDNTGQIIFEDIYGTSGIDINIVEAWDIETGNSDVVIAVLDAGIEYNNPDLEANMWVNEDEIPDNGIDDDGNGYIDDYYGFDFGEQDSDPIDSWSHGTSCASVIAAVSNNEIGIAGVAWNCKIMNVKLFDDRGGSNMKEWAEGMLYAADNGADIFSMSIGLYGDPNILKDALDYAYDQGCVLVAAAGNFNTSKKLYPAGYDNVISVSAINQNNERCDVDDWGMNLFYPTQPLGSQFGYWIDVTAPGNLVYTIMPTYHAGDNDIFNYNTGRNYTQNYDWRFGTSFSCPHVAGLAALLLSQDPTLTQEEIRKIIRANVDPYISDEYMGTGRINAYKALTRFNSQPEIPETPTGEISGKTGKTYTYTTSASDPDGDQLYYVWDWNDGNYSDPIGPYNAGELCEVDYAWGHDGNYSIMVKATDMKGGESYWSDPLLVSMPLIHQKPLLTLIQKLFDWLEEIFERDILPGIFNL